VAVKRQTLYADFAKHERRVPFFYTFPGSSTSILSCLIVRKNALQFPHYPDPLPLSKGGMTVSNGGHWSSSPLSRTQLRIDTQLGGRTDDGRTIQCTMSVEEPEAYPTSPVLCDSPLQWVLCDGWCQYNTIAHPTVVSAFNKSFLVGLREMTTFYGKQDIAICVFRLAACLGRSQWIAIDRVVQVS
jgi:hypothetical protein